jgi:hypothetical protein
MAEVILVCRDGAGGPRHPKNSTGPVSRLYIELTILTAPEVDS